MQHLQFTSKSASDNPDAQVFFVTPAEVTHVPAQCYTVYIADKATDTQLASLIKDLPQTALVVDYTGSAPLPSLHPKRELEEQATKKWQEVTHFLSSQHIDIKKLATSQFIEIDAMDTALDALLSASHEFLQVASAFQHALELSQPQRIPKTMLQCFNTMTLLAYRVQALTPGVASSHVLRTYQEDETFFLHEIISELSPEGETMQETIAGHYSAGRSALATALERALEDPRFTEYSSYAIETRERLRQLK